MIFDFINLLDLCAGFFTSFYDFEENLIINIKRSSINYIRTYFFIDFIAALPFNTIFELDLYFYSNYKQIRLFNNEHFSGISLIEFYKYRQNSEDSLEKSNNLNDNFSVYDSFNYNYKDTHRFLKLMRLWKIFKIFSSNKFYEWLKENLNNENFIKPPYSKIIFYYFFFFNITHILNCVFILLGNY